MLKKLLGITVFASALALASHADAGSLKLERSQRYWLMRRSEGNGRGSIRLIRSLKSSVMIASSSSFCIS